MIFQGSDGVCVVEEADQVESGKSDNQKRKKNYCTYCNTLVNRFSRHLESKHKDKPEGLSLLNINAGNSKEKRLKKMEVTDNIRKKWNAIYNKKIMDQNKNDGTLNIIPVKKRHGGESVGSVLCKHCQGLYRRDKLFLHLRKCSEFKNSTGQTINDDRIAAIKCHSLPNMSNLDHVSDVFRREILEGIHMDTVTEVALNEPTILKFANDFHESRREASSKSYVIREMRDLGRLFIQIKQLNSSITTFKECFSPKHFQTLVEAALILAEYNKETGHVNVPSIAYRLSQPIKDAANLEKSEGLEALYDDKNADRSKVTEIDDFLTLMATNWSKKIGRVCKKAEKKAKADRNDKMTHEDDIIKVASFIEGSYRKLIANLEKSNNKKKTFDQLLNYLVTHIMLLIRRRPVDFKHAKLQHYNNIDKHDELIDMAGGKELSGTDLETCKKFHLFYVPGKNLEIMPIVLTPLMKTVMDTLILHRTCVGINNDTLFMLSGGKLINPTQSLSQIATKVSLKKPTHFTGNGLRHQAATFSKLHSNHPQYQSYLASALGHTLAVHRKHYDLPLGVLQKILVCPVLNDIMTGKSKNIEQNKKTVQSEQSEGDGNTRIKNITNIVKVGKKSHKQAAENSDFVLSSCSSTSDEEYSSDEKKHTKIRWTESEQSAVFKHFGADILKQIIPKRKDVVHFYEENRQYLHPARTVAQLVLFLRNHALRKQKGVRSKVERILKN